MSNNILRKAARGFLVLALLTVFAVTTHSCRTTSERYVLPSVQVVGVSVEDTTLHVMYTGVYRQEDPFLLERAVRETSCTHLVMHLHNYGGSALVMFDMVDTLTNIRDSGIHVTTMARGMIASAAVPIFVQGDVRIMQKSAWVMLHPGGWRADHVWQYHLTPSEQELFLAWERHYANIVAERTHMTVEDVLKILTTGNPKTGQVFFDSQKALELDIATILR